jgi:hypothetical protein
MNNHPSFQKTCLAALLLACCCSAVAEPDTGTLIAQEPVQSQANVPAIPANQPVTATGPGAQDPVAPDAPVPGESMVENAENPDTAGLHDDSLPAGESGYDATGDTDSADSPETPSAPAVVIAPELLLGQWTVKEQHPDAGEVVTLFSINPDSSFAGTMTVAGDVVWSYSGNWYLDGNLITWFYTRSTPPLMLVDETEVDEIISVDSEKLVYLSGKRDVLETLYRAR